MLERFTERARKVMDLADLEARRFKHEYIGTEHILLGLVEEGSGVGATVLKKHVVDLQEVRVGVEKLVKGGPDEVTIDKLPQTQRAKNVIEHAIKEGRRLKQNYVDTGHLLLGLLLDQDGVAAQVLNNLNVRLADVHDDLGILTSDEALPTSSASGSHPNQEQGIHSHQPLTLLLDPGSATREEIAEFFVEISTLYRMLGGSGITFKSIDAKEPVIA